MSGLDQWLVWSFSKLCGCAFEDQKEAIRWQVINLLAKLFILNSFRIELFSLPERAACLGKLSSKIIQGSEEITALEMNSKILLVAFKGADKDSTFLTTVDLQSADLEITSCIKLPFQINFSQVALWRDFVLVLSRGASRTLIHAFRISQDSLDLVECGRLEDDAYE